MRLTFIERESCRELFSPKIFTNDLQNHLSTEMFELLKSKSNLKTVADRLLFFNATKYRPYDSVHITKFLTPEFDCAKSIISLIEDLTPPFTIYIDFHFCFEVMVKDPENQNKIELKFQRASKPSSFNRNFKMTKALDLEKLSAELRGKTQNDFLNLVFVHHTDLYAYGGSGFKPYQLIALNILIQKFPK